MKYLIISIAVTIFAQSSFAESVSDLKTAVVEARDSLVIMLKNKDKRDSTQQKLVKETADKVSSMLNKINISADKKDKFEEFKKTWNEFKKTREVELVPAILSGKQEDADKVATGIQKERYKKMNELLGEIEK